MMNSLHETPLRFNSFVEKALLPLACLRVSFRAAAIQSSYVTLFVLLLFVLPAKAASAQTEDSFPLFQDDLDQDSLHRAIHRSLEYLQRLPPDRPVGEWPGKITAKEVKESLLAFMEHLPSLHQPETLLKEVRSRFDLFEPAGDPGEGKVLVTGYYQPLIDGSLIETQAFRFPVYGRPKDLIEAEQVTLGPQLRVEKVVGRLIGDRWAPYLSRHEIDSLGRLRGKGYEIAWVKDRIDLFFLHIQGSGLLRLEDGRLLHLSYAASNGRPYRSIGRVLIDSGEIPAAELSMQRLRRYLREHPEKRDALLAQNESYVFFRFVKAGPLGSLGVPLTAGRSVATDARLFPKGALAFIVSSRPIFDAAENIVGWRPFSRFVLNQDTGSAIQGPRRLDLYFGSGAEAGQAAGAMKSAGRLYFLLKKRPNGLVEQK
jgi:membrane-bound lytic murein transglycosylase A